MNGRASSRSAAALLALLAAGAAPLAAQSGHTLRGLVWDSLGGRGPLSGATVLLAGREQMTTSDTLGRFRFDSVPAGPVRIDVLHPWLDSLGLGGLELDAPADWAGTADTTLGLVVASRAPATLANAWCPSRRQEAGAVVGIAASRETGQPVEGVRVALRAWRWTVGRAGLELERAQAETGADGRIVLCNLLARQVASLEVRTPRGDTSVVRVELPESGAAWLMLPVSAPPRMGTVAGRVAWQDGTPVAQATVTILTSGEPILARTGADGAFAVAEVPVGLRRVEVRAIGGRVPSRLVRVPADGRVEVAFTGERSAVVLPEMVTEAATASWLESNGFLERQATGLGQYLGTEAIEQRRAARAGDLFTAFRGLRVIQRNGSTVLENPRATLGAGKYGTRSETDAGEACVPVIFLDGARASPPPTATLGSNTTASDYLSIDNLVPAGEIAAIEYYSSPAGLPPQFLGSDTGCGVVVVWTRR